MNAGAGRQRVRRHGRPRSTAGFTLIEILAVTVILGLLAALVVPKILGRTDDARRIATKVQMRNIEQALHLFKMDTGVYPSTEQGPEALVHHPTVGAIPRHWREGGYLPKVPKDSWDRPFLYRSCSLTCHDSTLSLSVAPAASQAPRRGLSRVQRSCR